jgi:hypothetical protein
MDFCVVAQEVQVVGCLLMKQQAQKGDRNEKKASMFAFFHFGSLRLLERVCSCLCASVADTSVPSVARASFGERA